MQRRNLTARAAMWSARHRRTAIFGWLAFVLVTVALGSMVGTKQLSDNNNGVGESGRADQILDAKFPQTASEQVLLQSGKLTISDPQFQSAVRDVVGRLSGIGTVQNAALPAVAVQQR